MRPPLSRDRRPLRADCVLFFRRGGPWGSPPLATCSDVVALGWGGAPRLHHTLLAGLPPAPGRWPSAAGDARRPSHLSVPSYRPLPKRGGLALGAREVQARGRGSPWPPGGPAPRWPGARGGVPANAQGQRTGPLGS